MLKRRIAIIGTGWVGASVAISTLHSGIADELLLDDSRKEMAEGEAMDLAHGGSFYPSATVRAAAIGDMQAADAIVVAAPQPRCPYRRPFDPRSRRRRAR